MKNIFYSLALLLSFCWLGTLQAQDTYNARLSGQQESIPVATLAEGSITATLVGNILTVEGSFSNLSSNYNSDIGAHIHQGFAGRNGDVIFTLAPVIDMDNRGGSFVSAANSFTLSNDQITALNNREFYINIHSVNYPGGELRGQLLADSDEVYTTSLLGSNEVPNVVSSGHGGLILELSGDQLTVSGGFNNLDGDFDATIGGHLHLGFAGQNGDPVITLMITPDDDNKGGIINPDLNSFLLNAEQKTALENRQFYANIHTTLFPSGELRGQVTKQVTTLFRAHLSGSNEVPVVTSLGIGQVIGELDGNMLTLSGSFSNLGSNIQAGHVHIGFAGRAGDVFQELSLDLDTDQLGGRININNSFMLNAGDISALFRRGFYINIHTTNHPAGELRGQLLPASQVVYNAFLSGAFEIPSVETPASGALKAELSGNQLTLSGAFNDLQGDLATSLDGGVHIHLGMAGNNGTIEFGLNAIVEGNDRNAIFEAENNTFTLTATQVSNLKARMNYINIHSRAFIMGELRGQLLPEATTYFVAPLSGTSERPLVDTEASGLAILEINGELATLTGAFSNLESNFAVNVSGGAHLHDEFAGSAGPISTFLTPTIANDQRQGFFAANDNQFTITQERLDTLIQRRSYLNIHTVNTTGGELRGQLLPFANSYFTSNLSGANEVPANNSTAEGGIKAELIGDQLIVTGRFEGLTSDYDPMVGSHLHIGRNGTNGDVAIPLMPSLAPDNRRGVYFASTNTFTLTEEQIIAVRAGRFYVNIHTIDFPAGEIRGQLLPETNSFPEPTIITIPVEGAVNLIEGLPEEIFTFEWEQGVDRDTLTYIWQLSNTPEFSVVLAEESVDTTRQITYTYQEIDAIFSSLNFALGAQVDLFHRVISSDGSVQTIGDNFVATFERGVVTAPVGYRAELSGRNEVLPIVTPASGSVNAIITNLNLELSGTFDNLLDTVLTDLAGGAHLHIGFPGENGAVAVPLNITLDEDKRGGTFEAGNNTFTLTEQQRDAFIGRQMYVNIHSAAFPDGELRGQVLPPSDATYATNLFGNYEVPTVMSSGHGAVTLDIAGDQLTVAGTFADIDGDFDINSGSAAHLHIGLPGQNGGVTQALMVRTNGNVKSGEFNPADNVYTLTQEQIAAIQTGNVYVNVHTSRNPDGELRGQVSAPVLAVFRAHLSGSNEIPVVTTEASGMVIAELRDDNTLTVSGTFQDLESDVATEIAGGAHIHIGFAGANGSVAFPLALTLNANNRGGSFLPAGNVFPLDDAQVNALLERRMYVNIHTADNQSGELRGQLLPESQIVFNGHLAGLFEVPAANTLARGAVKAELLGNQLTLTGSYHNLESDLATAIAGGGHIHTGAAGQNGLVQFPLAITGEDMAARNGNFAAAGNTYTLTDGQVDSLRARLNYINLHSADNQGGELRAQLLPEATTYFVAALGGNNEVPAVNTNASGMAIVEVNGLNGVVTGSFMGLETDFAVDIAGGAHIHTGFAGSTGGVSQLIATTLDTDNRSGLFEASDNQFALTMEAIDTLRQRRSYVNLHSLGNEGGEIRGQLLPLSTNYFTTYLAGINEVPPANSVGIGALKMELIDSTLTVSGSFNNLASKYNGAIGSHLHLGGVGTNGDVVFALDPIVPMDSLSAVYLAENNRFQLSTDQVAAFRAGDFYANVHTAAFPAGELRGQGLLEINNFPSAPALTFPINDTLLTIAGTPSEPFQVDWTGAEDRDDLAYIWQVGGSPNFAVTLFQENVGDALQFNTTYADIDTLLNTLSVAVGDTITLYHRVMATDGSLSTPSAPDSVRLVRGTVGLAAYTAQLSGNNEVLPVLTMASGSIEASVDGNMLTVSGSFDNLMDTVATDIAGGAHIHLGYAGENGDVLFPLVIDLDDDRRGGTFASGSNTFELSEEQQTAFFNRQMYVNIHSGAFRGGELRGQIIPADNQVYQTNLLGNYEVPTVMSSGHGALVLDIEGTTLTVSGAFADLEGDFDASVAGGAHLHLGLAGQNGDVTIALVATTTDDLKGGVFNPADNTFELDADQMAALAARNVYANIHTTTQPSGELRGQIHEPLLAKFRAHLSGSNEVPVVTTTANGMLVAELTNDSTLVVTGSFAGLESDMAIDIAGGAHLHFGLAGQAGEVTQLLRTTITNDQRGGSYTVANNTFVIDSTQKAALFNRGIYANIHSVNNQGGELRGQLLPEAQIIFNGFLSSIFEVPVANSAAHGAVKAELLGNQLTVSGSFADLSSALATEIAGGAHIHVAPAGSTGGVEFLLDVALADGSTNTGSFNAHTNTFTLTDGQVDTLRARLNYVNIHSADIQSGELRAQLLPEATTYFVAALGGNSEVPAVNTAATGMAIVEVNGENAILTGSFNGLESAFNPMIAGGAHIHTGFAGSNGGVAISINTNDTASDTSGIFNAANNQFAISSELLDTMRQRRNYVNIHSMDTPSGEIRGQLLPLANSHFTAYLAGINEVPPANTAALGGLKMELTGNNLTLSGSFNNLSSRFDASIAGGSHLHIGSVGTNGDVAIVLNPIVPMDSLSAVYPADSNTFVLTDDQLAAFRAGDFYTNIHTEAFQGGELRGQALGEINFFPSAPAITNPEPDSDVTIQGSPSNELSINWTPATDRDELAYIWQLSGAENFAVTLIEENVGSATVFTTTLGAIDTLLATAGVAVGDTITLYHRAIATDGSLSTPSETAEVRLIRGVVAPPTGYVARLSGANEVLPISTMASGQVTAELDGNVLTLQGSFDNLTDTVATSIAGGAHIHLGYAGQNGAVVQVLDITLDDDRLGGSFLAENNTYTLADSLITALNDRQLYINIHSAAFEGGELRAQIVPASDLAYQSNLFGNYEVPTVMSSGHGALTFEITENELVVTGSFADLDGEFDANIAGGAHLHMGMAGQNGDVFIPLVATTSDDLRSGVFTSADNTFEITDEQKNFFATRSVYANIHTTAVASGELRGQPVEPSMAVFRAHLSGSNEVPVVTTTAQGMVVAELINDSTLVVSGSFSGLESDFAADIAGGAHIHLGLAGSAGAVQFPLVTTLDTDSRGGLFNSGSNRFDITAEQKAALYNRELYINIHSADNQAGELRGQILPESQVVFNGFLAGIFEVPTVSTAANGAVKAELLGNQLTVSGSFTDLSSSVAIDIAGGAHIHTGAAGRTGDVIFPLVIDLGNPSTAGTFVANSNTFELSDDQVSALKMRLNYVNIHSESNQAGELRAQLLPEATTYFVAALAGNSEVPAVNTSATGMAIVEVNGTNGILSGAFSGLTSAFATDVAGGAHIHTALAGSNGDVSIFVNTDNSESDTSGVFRAVNNQIALTSGMIDTMRQRMNYVNIHSTGNPSGEIRGQLLPLATSYYTTNLLGINEVDPINTAASGGLKLELTGDQLTVTGSFNALESDFNDQIAGGAHLHIGSASMNGEVIIPLVTDTLGNATSGIYTAAENTFTLDAEQITAVRAGNVYANIHTDDNVGGELRGQILPEINFFPTASMITAPVSGTVITVDTMSQDDLVVTWTEATDQNEVVYIYELSTDADFNNDLVFTNLGNSLSYTASQNDLDNILLAQGVADGDSLTLYHRVTTSDGSLNTVGAADSIILTKEEEIVEIESTVYTAQLSGSNEVLPVLTMASGQVTATLTDSILTVTGSFENLTDSVATSIAGGAHIHIGYAGQNGDVAFGLVMDLAADGRSGTFAEADNTFILEEAMIEALNNRQLYVNIHTVANMGGELRGQILPVNNTAYQTNLFGNYEVPSVMSNGHGALSLDIQGDTLTVTGAFAELDGDFDATIGGGAHLHLGLAGQNGDVSLALTANVTDNLKSGIFTPESNTFILTGDQLAALQQNNFYANIHTTTVASGEIRGQVHNAGLATFRAHLSGSNEVPVVTTRAQGMLIATLTNDSTLVVSGSFDGLESDFATDIAGGAHIHLGAAGEAGDVVFLLSSEASADARSATFSASENIFAITSEQKAALYARGMYVNIHSENNQAGELRGQLLPESQVVFNGFLSGAFEVIPVETAAQGAVKVELLGNQITVTGSFRGMSSGVATDIAGGAHIHLGAAGSNGPVIFPLTLDLSPGGTVGSFPAISNTFELNEEQITALKARLNYINIHTALNQGGELRGQLLPEATTYFVAAMGGNSEVPAVDTEATGMAIIEVNGNNGTLSGSFNGLESGFNVDLAGGAHIHAAYAGRNGDIVQLVNAANDTDTSATFTAMSNQFTLTDGYIDTLRQRQHYLNIHSLDNAGGEIRGQFLPLSNSYFTTRLAGINEVQPVTTAAMGGLKLELTGNQLVVTGSFNNLESAFNADIEGGAHLHLAGPAMNGDVIIPLVTTLSDDNLNGIYTATDNTFEVTDEQAEAIRTGQVYANIHSTEIASGELRGQVLPEINFFPDNAPMITAPVDGTAINTGGDPDEAIQATWTAATDRDEVVYIWQLAADSIFTNILVNVNVGTSPEFNTTVGTADSLLNDAGIPVGGTATLYHRGIASDGSLNIVGDAVSIVVTRGVTVDADYIAILSGQHEVLPVASQAYGEILGNLDGNVLSISGSFSNLTDDIATQIAGGAHIHLGYAGENGDVNFLLDIQADADNRGGTFVAEENTFTLNSNQLAALANRQLYVNIHTEAYLGGEIRGQLLPTASEVFTTNLLGNNQVPAVITQGHGSLILDVQGNQMIISGAFNDLEGNFDTNIAGGAHLHLGVAGTTGDVIIPITARTNGNNRRGRFIPEDNVYTITDEQLMALRNHEIYANIHTTTVPSGEIRGQVVPIAKTGFRAHLSGSNEIPVVTSMAGGQVIATFSNDSTLVVSGSFAGLESDIATDVAGGAHIHFGLAGQNGDIVTGLNMMIGDDNRSATFSATDNTFILNAAQIDALYARGLYINIHSADNTAGELRGQILPETQSIFTGFLSGIFETPVVSTDALGGLKAELMGNRLVVTGSFDNLGSRIDTEVAGGAHLHNAPAGRNGNVIFLLEPTIDADGMGGQFEAANNTFELDDDEVFQLITREIYANIHSQEEQSGELRAQLLHEAATYFVAPLSGASVVPATNTDGTGMLVVEITPNQAIYSGAYQNLNSTLAANVAGGTHVHNGYAGQNGARIGILSAASDGDGSGGIFGIFGNTFDIDMEGIEMMRLRNTYIDLHTQEHLDGELRGQLLPLASAYFHTSLRGENEVQPLVTSGLGGLKMELTGDQLVITGAFEGLIGDYDTNIGTHLHLAGVGVNGDVVLPLQPSVTADLRSAVFLAEENTYTLDEGLRTALRSGSLYANVHSTAFASGELRGQVLVEINDFPSNGASINSPANGTTVSIAGEGSTPFTARWMRATDRDDLAYIWQLSLTPEFDEIVINQNVGAELEFSTNYVTIDAILAAAGVQTGQTATLYHRAIASDGSEFTPGATAQIDLVRDGIVSIDNPILEQFSLEVFPTLTTAYSEIQVNINAAKNGSAQLVMFNNVGQLIDNQSIELSVGEQSYPIQLNGIAAGTYFVQLQIDGVALPIQKVVVQ